MTMTNPLVPETHQLRYGLRATYLSRELVEIQKQAQPTNTERNTNA